MTKPIEKTEETFPKLDEESVQERRRFMKRTLNLTAMLAAAGLSESVLEAALLNDAEAADMTMKQPTPMIKQPTATMAQGVGSERDFANALSMAARDGNSNKALQQFGAKISPQQQQVLQGMSRKDLNTLMSLKRKLEGGAAACCDAGATIF